MHRRRGTLFLLVVVVALGAGIVFWRPALRWLAEYPDIGQPPVKAEAVLVLAGGWQGERILRAGELVRAGYAPYALVSSPTGWYGLPECEAAKGFAVKRGFPEEYFVCVPIQATSTREEAARIVPALRERKLRRVLLVTVSTHLRRAAALFREAAPEVEFTPVSAQPLHYESAQWWTTREGRKAIFMEWLKLITGPFGI
ncbi:MAG: YdcF family protein [Bryobacteraceae bacterium]|nr:YdcF family protein [Bryobacteraceae bacterium]